jgi:hypothetical protein
MASLFRDGQKPPPKALELIIRLFHKATHPLFLGIVSLEVGWSLARTQEMFNLLASEKTIRRATAKEKAEFGLRPDANVYVLVGKAEASKANW